MAEHAPLQPITGSLLEDLNKATKTYEEALAFSDAEQYLLDRGLTEETVSTYRVGVVSDPLPAHQRYVGWLAIPYIVKGDTVAIRFRRPDWISTEGAKYGQPSGETLRTFNTTAILEAGSEIHVTEGEFDAMILNQIGLPAIGLPGANTFRGHHARMLSGFNRIWVWGDPDQAGAEFVQKITNRLPRAARGVPIKGGDITDVYAKCGAEELLELVA